MRFRALVIPSGNACGVEVPPEVKSGLGPEARPPIVVSINGHSWRSRIALMRGLRLIGISAANRRAAGICEGEVVEVEVARDEGPREVDLPPDLAAAFGACPPAAVAFAALPFGLRAKHIAAIEAARSPNVRSGRIGRLVDDLSRAANTLRRGAS